MSTAAVCLVLLVGSVAVINAVKPGHPGGLSCNEVGRMLADYRDGLLAETAQLQVQVHLEACPKCRHALHRIQEEGENVGTSASEGLVLANAHASP